MRLVQALSESPLFRGTCQNLAQKKALSHMWLYKHKQVAQVLF